MRVSSIMIFRFRTVPMLSLRGVALIGVTLVEHGHDVDTLSPTFPPTLCVESSPKGIIDRINGIANLDLPLRYALAPCCTKRLD
jgi:hypothetical protein